MLPASLVGVLFVVALVPGSIYLARTDGKRSPSGDSSAIEEVLALVVAGASTVLPPLAIAMIALPDRVRASSRTARDFTTAPTPDVRSLGLSLIAVAAASILLAFIYAFIHNKSSSTVAAPDAWGPALGDLHDGEVLMVAVKLLDGTFLQGSSGGYSTSKNGRSRDLVLGKPISVKLNGGELKTRRRFRRMVISESQIAYFSTSRQPRS